MLGRMSSGPHLDRLTKFTECGLCAESWARGTLSDCLGIANPPEDAHAGEHLPCGIRLRGTEELGVRAAVDQSTGVSLKRRVQAVSPRGA